MVSGTTLIAGLDHEIAQAIARRIALHPDSVTPREADEPAPLLDHERKAVEILTCNLADRSAIESALARIDADLGPLNHVIFGTTPPARQSPLHATTHADWTNTVDATLAAVFHLCQAAMPRLAERKQGRVLFLLSDYAVIGMDGGAAFAASQAALYAFAKSLAREFAPAGIRVNCLGTGWRPTGQNGEIPMGRAVRPDDVAAAAEFLLSNRASYITGQLLQPNGGSVTW